MKYEADGSDPAVLSTLTPALIGKFPTATAGNFKYNSGKETLVFSDNVYDDGDITAVKRHDEEWENRGTTAFVYDDTFERQWDTWVGPKRSSLFTASLGKSSGSWVLGEKFVNVLNGTKHVRVRAIFADL